MNKNLKLARKNALNALKILEFNKKELNDLDKSQDYYIELYLEKSGEYIHNTSFNLFQFREKKIKKILNTFVEKLIHIFNMLRKDSSTLYRDNLEGTYQYEELDSIRRKIELF